MWYDKEYVTVYIVLTLLFMVGMFLGGFIASYGYKGRILSLEDKLGYCETVIEDPHHCVSVCAEQFEKMGC